MITFRFKDMPKFNLKWWQPTQEQWAPILLRSQKPFWKNETTADGRPWKRLTPAYNAWKTKNYPGQPILRLTGQMQDTAKIEPANKGFSATTAFYGPYHQFGTSKMAARPWLGIPDRSLVLLSAIAWRNILSK